MRRFFGLICILAIASAAFAVPNVFSYQGKLTDTDGIGINDDVDITVRIYDAETGGVMLDSDALTDVPVVKGLFDIQYEADLSLADLSGDIYLELEIDGNVMIPRIKITAVHYATAAKFADSAYYAVKADSIGDYAASDFDGLTPNDLQGAYDAGNTITTAAGNAVSITAGTGTALYVTSLDGNGIWNEASYWSPSGNISLGTGYFHSNNGLFQSNTDFIAKLDADDTENASFLVRNSGDVDVFEVMEDGNVRIDGYLNLSNITNLSGDTIWIDRKVWVDELVTDTIESRGDVVFLKDAFGIRDSLWFDGEWRTDWPAGGASGDFIDDQYAAPQDAEFWIDGRGAFGTDIASAEFDIWTEDFEDPTFPPTGWTQQYVTGTTDWVGSPSGFSGSYTHTGSGCAVFEYDGVSGNATSLITPTIDLSGHAPGSVFLQFWHMQREWFGDQDTLALYYSNDGGSTWNLLGSWSMNVSNYILRTFTLPNLSDEYQLMFYAFEDYGYGVHIDDVRIYYVDESAVLPKIVANGNTGNIELLTATGDVLFNGIGLTTTGGAEIVGYENSISGLLATDVQGAIDEMAATPIISKLDTLWAGDLGDITDTIYAMDNFYINGELIVDSIQAKGPRIFLDDHITVNGCATIGGGVVPMDTVFFEDFESGLGAWTVADSSGSGKLWNTTNSAGRTPDPSADISGLFPIIDSDHAGSGFHVWTSLASPDIDLSSYSAAQLMFGNHFRRLSSDYGNLYVWDGASWVLLHTYNSTTYGKEIFDITPYINSDFQVMFVYNDNSSWAWYWMVDNVTIVAPSGAAPPKVEICAGSVIVDEDVIVSGNVEAGTFTLNGITITDWPTGGGGGITNDTIWSEDENPADTIVAMAQLKVYGELIADSIQAAGSRIHMDDLVNFRRAVSLGEDSTWRTDWEAQYVVTVGMNNNSDFTTIDDALAAIAANGWPHALIDVAPGIYAPATPIIIPAGVHLRGSGMNSTTIRGEVTIRGVASRLAGTSDDDTWQLFGDVSYCKFDCSVIAGDMEGRTAISNCTFGGEGSLGLTQMGRIMDCSVNVTTMISGIWKFSGNAVLGHVNVMGEGTVAHIHGCTFMDGGLGVVGQSKAYIESNLFTTVMEEIGPALVVDNAEAEVKANHFINRRAGAVLFQSGSLNFLSNDVIECGAMAAGAIVSFPTPLPSTINIIGNHIDGRNTPIAGVQLIGIDGWLASLKDNVIEGHGTGAVLVGLNTLPTDPTMSVDNNLIYKNLNDGLSIGAMGMMGKYLITHNNIYFNDLAGVGAVDLNIQGGFATVSHNVLDTYTSVFSPVPGALNTQTAGMIWTGAIQIGQLP
ncbi:MAG TPA: hypothetical protein ENN07_02740 [candidate division Zixibacteria bacterium]|nr:hypothetical protein [candidate division Zixibacteria bacterium]